MFNCVQDLHNHLRSQGFTPDSVRLLLTQHTYEAHLKEYAKQNHPVTCWTEQVWIEKHLRKVYVIAL